jgi:hypothetical protein
MNILTPSPTVHGVTTDDGTVLLDIGRGRFYGLNPTGSAVWRLLAQGCSAEQITGDLASRFEVPADRVRADVATVITQLRDRDLLRTSTSGPV